MVYGGRGKLIHQQYFVTVFLAPLLTYYSIAQSLPRRCAVYLLGHKSWRLASLMFLTLCKLSSCVVISC